MDQSYDDWLSGQKTADEPASERHTKRARTEATSAARSGMSGIGRGPQVPSANTAVMVPPEYGYGGTNFQGVGHVPGPPRPQPGIDNAFARFSDPRGRIEGSGTGEDQAINMNYTAANVVSGHWSEKVSERTPLFISKRQPSEENVVATESIQSMLAEINRPEVGWPTGKIFKPSVLSLQQRYGYAGVTCAAEDTGDETTTSGARITDVSVTSTLKGPCEVANYWSACTIQPSSGKHMFLVFRLKNFGAKKNAVWRIICQPVIAHRQCDVRPSTHPSDDGTDAWVVHLGVVAYHRNDTANGISAEIIENLLSPQTTATRHIAQEIGTRFGTLAMIALRNNRKMSRRFNRAIYTDRMSSPAALGFNGSGRNAPAPAPAAARRPVAAEHDLNTDHGGSNVLGAGRRHDPDSKEDAKHTARGRAATGSAAPQQPRQVDGAAPPVEKAAPHPEKAAPPNPKEATGKKARPKDQ